MVNLAILANLVFLVNLASLTKLVNLAQWPCTLINFPVSFFSLLLPPCYFPLVTSPLLLPTYNFLLPPCYLITSSLLLITFSLLPYYFLLTTYYFLLPTLLPYYFPLSPYYFFSFLLTTFSPHSFPKATTPSPFIPSINMRKGCSKRTCLTCCVSSTAGMASRISLRKRPSGMFVSIVK